MISLPTEVLERIFRSLFDLVGFGPLEDDEDSFSVLSEDLEMAFPKSWYKSNSKKTKDLSIFPYCISRVCSRWNKICLRIPKFWRCVVIDIGSQAVSVLQVARELEASKNMRIEVYMSRRDGFDIESRDAFEHNRMGAFVKILSQHIDRCIVLNIRILHRSSLPSIQRHLFGTAPILQNLEIRSCPTDADDKTVFRYSLSPGGLLFTPQIETVELDSFLFLHYMIKLRITPATQDKFTHLTIVGFSGFDSESGLEFPVLDTVHTLYRIPTLMSVSLKGFRFDQEELRHLYMSGEIFECPLVLSDMELEDIQPHAASILMHLLGGRRHLERLVITNCPVSDVRSRFMPSAYNVELSCIDGDENLTPVLRGSNPVALTIFECPSFVTDTIEEMFEGPPDTWICSKMGELTISAKNGDLSNYLSLTAFRELVSTRLEGVGSRTKIESLGLYAFNHSNIHNEDLDWLNWNVKHFSISPEYQFNH